jgi:hypothetical protein
MSFNNGNKIITAAVSNIKEMRKKIFNLPVLGGCTDWVYFRVFVFFAVKSYAVFRITEPDKLSKTIVSFSM